MENIPSVNGIELGAADWSGTPLSVQQLVLSLWSENQALKKRLSLVEEQIKQNSQNSSRPPSGDGFGQKKVEKNIGEKRTRGGQQGHRGHEPHLYAESVCREIHDHLPSTCKACGVELSGIDEHPYRHQSVEIPPIVPEIIEHRLHQLMCPHCGISTRAPLPAHISHRTYGERLCACIAWLSSDYRQSHGQLKQLLARLFGIEISRASINRVRQQMSDALAPILSEAHTYIQSQPLMHSDETSFAQGNGDGQNPKLTKGWLWVLVTQSVTVFEVALSRGQVMAQTMIGAHYDGIVISDRYSSYAWLDAKQRQVCWAHLKRDFTAMAERTGVSQEIGQALLERQKRLFRWWHRVRDGTMGRDQFQRAVAVLRQAFTVELEIAAALTVAPKEKSPLAKTVRTCRQILKLESALWTFVDVPGVEPTNNAAEQALRPAVIWRRTSFGSQSQGGSQFVARMLSVVTSLKAQNRDVWDFLTLVVRAHRLDLPMPSLIPLKNLSP